ncbi:hypothetical protein [Streptomyces minutiscleroticus]|uniref:Uncharacterized protein n=1 Tax=Streptomyces minutiscleroticus TaxID=68238 RepID=A0A918NPR3_9ACTN|nr:hypothetical protein [Streptomyces minutiscleroticus]GGX86211.1 hypothetical protein GCM10010358_45490 [Streptomyces minutiscleroticus]
MQTFVETATAFPVILFTAALVVVVCFWLLVAAGVTAADSFDEDADLEAWGMGGVPVAVAVSLLTVFAWLLAVGATVLLVPLAPADETTLFLRPLVSAVALGVAWCLTCLSVRPLRRPASGGAGTTRRRTHDGTD